jgi:hypothetical protein
MRTRWPTTQDLNGDLIKIDPDPEDEPFAIDPLVWWEHGLPTTLSASTTNEELLDLAEAAQAQAARFIPGRHAYLVEPERYLHHQRSTLRNKP